MTLLRAIYPFTVRLENGRVYAKYVSGAAVAAQFAECQHFEETGQQSPAVLVIRADEPFYRNRSRLRRLLDWLGS